MCFSTYARIWWISQGTGLTGPLLPGTLKMLRVSERWYVEWRPSRASRQEAIPAPDRFGRRAWTVRVVQTDLMPRPVRLTALVLPRSIFLRSTGGFIVDDEGPDLDVTALGERIADLEEMLDRAPSDPALQRRIADEISRLRALIVLAGERSK